MIVIMWDCKHEWLLVWMLECVLVCVIVIVRLPESVWKCVYVTDWMLVSDCMNDCEHVIECMCAILNQIKSKSNQITFIVTSQHMCLGEWNSWERAPNRNNLHTYYTVHTYRLIQKTMCRIHIHIVSTHSVLLRHTYSYQYTLYTVCTHSTFCTHIYTQ